jgi:hypothetical protein
MSTKVTWTLLSVSLPCWATAVLGARRVRKLNFQNSGIEATRDLESLHREPSVTENPKPEASKSQNFRRRKNRRGF